MSLEERENIGGTFKIPPSQGDHKFSDGWTQNHWNLLVLSTYYFVWPFVMTPLRHYSKLDVCLSDFFVVKLIFQNTIVFAFCRYTYMLLSALPW